MRDMFKRIVAIAILLAVFPLAQADGLGHLPYYGGFALGFSSADSECDYYGYNCDGDDTSFKIYFGKRLHENLALEASFQDLGKLRDKGFTEDRLAASSGINLSVLGIIPTGDFGYAYGKMGFMAWEADYTRIGGAITRSSEDGSDMTYGAGFAFVFDDKYEFRIEYERLHELGDDFIPGGEAVEVGSFSGTIYFD